MPFGIYDDARRARGERFERSHPFKLDVWLGGVLFFDYFANCHLFGAVCVLGPTVRARHYYTPRKLLFGRRWGLSEDDLPFALRAVGKEIISRRGLGHLRPNTESHGVWGL